MMSLAHQADYYRASSALVIDVMSFGLASDVEMDVSAHPGGEGAGSNRPHRCSRRGVIYLVDRFFSESVHE